MLGFHLTRNEAVGDSTSEANILDKWSVSTILFQKENPTTQLHLFRAKIFQHEHFLQTLAIGTYSLRFNMQTTARPFWPLLNFKS